MATWNLTLPIPSDMVAMKTYSKGSMPYQQFVETYGFVPHVKDTLEQLYLMLGYYPAANDTIKYNEPTILRLYRDRYIDQMRSAGAAASKSAKVSSAITTSNREIEQAYKDIAAQSAAIAASKSAKSASYEATKAADAEKAARAEAAASAAKSSSEPAKEATIIETTEPDGTQILKEEAAAVSENAISDLEKEKKNRNYILVGGSLLLAYLMLRK